MSRSITITSDDEMYPKVAALMFGDKADVEAVSPETKSKKKAAKVKKEEVEEEDAEGNITKADLEVGQTVLVSFGDDGDVECEVTSMPPKNKKQIQVTPQDTGEPEMIDLTDIIEIVADEESDDDDDDGEEEGGLEWAKDDLVEFKKGRKVIEGVIRSVDEKKETVKVKIEGERKLELVAFDKLTLLEEDEE